MLHSNHDHQVLPFSPSHQSPAHCIYTSSCFLRTLSPSNLMLHPLPPDMTTICSLHSYTAAVSLQSCPTLCDPIDSTRIQIMQCPCLRNVFLNEVSFIYYFLNILTLTLDLTYFKLKLHVTYTCMVFTCGTAIEIHGLGVEWLNI